MCEEGGTWTHVASAQDVTLATYVGVVPPCPFKGPLLLERPRCQATQWEGPGHRHSSWTRPQCNLNVRSYLALADVRGTRVSPRSVGTMTAWENGFESPVSVFKISIRKLTTEERPGQLDRQTRSLNPTRETGARI